MLALAAGTTLLIVLAALGLELEVVDGALAASRFFGSPFRHDIRPADIALRPLFEDLLSAFRQDVTVSGYASWDDVLDYCRRSANPVGRLVLRIFGYQDAAFDRWSDAICSALQLTNFWQDVKRDFDRGRTYMPDEELRVHRCIARLHRFFPRRIHAEAAPELRGNVVMLEIDDHLACSF